MPTHTPYMVDFRGFGLTPSDSTNTVTPATCVLDTLAALEWIKERHTTLPDQECPTPSLLGWSQGALIAHMAALHPKATGSSLISKLVLFGSIYDRSHRYAPVDLPDREVPNEEESALEDFTIPNSFVPTTARDFAVACLLCDPLKARWSDLPGFNFAPSAVRFPTLILSGRSDPYAPPRRQLELLEDCMGGVDDFGCPDYQLFFISGR